MVLTRLLTISALTGLAFSAIGDEYRKACKAVEAVISIASDVYYPGEYDCCGGEVEAHGWTGNPLYTKGVNHFMASSQESPACVVEPGTPEDVGKIVCLFRLASPGVFRHPR